MGDSTKTGRVAARAFLATLAASASLGAMSVAGAQTPGGRPTGPTAAPSGGTSTSTTVSDLIVTAQKREQSLQDVPIVVTVANAQLLQDTGVRDIKDLTVLTPGLLVTSTSTEASTTARIRGIGTVGDNAGLESSVGIVVDGVYRPRNGVGFGDLGELSRVEVLKGPQGTLFGKNTSAGVINILTAQPSFKFGANAEFTAGNYGEVGGSASVTGPLIADKLAGSLFFAQRKRDGFYDVVTGQGPRTLTEDQNRNFYTLRGQLLYDPTNHLSARLIVDYTRRSEDCCVAVQTVNAGTAAIIKALGGASGGIQNPPDPYARVAYSNRSTGQNVQDGGVSLEANYSPAWLGGAKITSVTAYRDWKYRNSQDSDFTTVDILYRPFNGDSGTEFKQFSQELRLGGTYGKFDYTVGGFYAHEKLSSHVSLLFGTQFSAYLSTLLSGATGGAIPAAALTPITNLDAPNTGQKDVYNQNDDTYALFGNGTYHITNKLELTGGIRYTSDEKTLDSSYTNSDGGKACSAIVASPFAGFFANTICQPFANPNFNGVKSHREHDEDAVTGTGKLSYRLNTMVLGYASYSYGYKSGGFNLDRIANPYAAPGTAGAPLSLKPALDTSFPGEFVDAYEIGVKTTLFDRRLYLNGAIFNQDFTGFQLNAFNGLYFTVVSVPKVISTGADFDVIWRPMPSLTAQGGVTYANTRYDRSDAAVLGSPTNAAFAATNRLPGSRVSLAPLLSLTGSATYEHPITDTLLGRINLGLKYNSSYNTGSDLNPLKKQGGYTVVDGRIGIGPQDKRWSLEFWASNLFDTDYYQVAFDATFQTGSVDAFLGQPRTFGVTLRARY